MNFFNANDPGRDNTPEETWEEEMRNYDDDWLPHDDGSFDTDRMSDNN